MCFFKIKKAVFQESHIMASGPGFEPRLIGPEPIVLPLDDPEIFTNLSQQPLFQEEFEHKARFSLNWLIQAKSAKF